MLNLTNPEPGSASVVLVEKLNPKAAPPKLPSTPEVPEDPEVPDVAEVPDVPEVPDVAEVPEVPELPAGPTKVAEVEVVVLKD